MPFDHPNNLIQAPIHRGVGIGRLISGLTTEAPTAMTQVGKAGAEMRERRERVEVDNGILCRDTNNTGEPLELAQDRRRNHEWY